MGPKKHGDFECNNWTLHREGCQPLELARVRLVRQDRREVHAIASEMMSADELVAEGQHGVSGRGGARRGQHRGGHTEGVNDDLHEHWLVQGTTCHWNWPS